MIGTIRKHSKALWLIIIVVIIFAFVIWGSKVGKGDAIEENFGEILGEKITRDSLGNAMQEARLSIFFSRGNWPAREVDLQREGYIRLFFIQKQRDYGIHVGNDAVAKAAGEHMRAFSRDGKSFTLDVFAKQILAPGGVTSADFVRYLQHELGLQQLRTVVSLGGGFVSANEIQSLYARENEEYSTQAAFFDATNYLAAVAVSPQALAEFYTNNMAAYRLGERVQVSYIRVPGSNFMAEAEVAFNQDTNMLDRLFQAEKDNATYKGNTDEETKANLRKRSLEINALMKARLQVNEFATRLFAVTPARAENLDLLARTNGMTVAVTEPLEAKDIPKGLPVGADFTQLAFRLSPEEPVAGPIVGEDGVYVIALKQRLPSENPSFPSVQARVTQDFKRIEAAKLARAAGQKFNQTLTNALAAGKTFMTVCTEAKVKPVLPPAFSLSTEKLPAVETYLPLNFFKQVVFSTPAGKASTYIPTAEGGFVVFVAAKLPVDEKKMQDTLPNFTRAIRQNRQTEAYNAWMNMEASRALGNVPYFRELQRQRQQEQQQQPPGAPSAPGPGI